LPKKEKTKKIKFLKAEFSAFWLSIATGIFACAFSFIYFPLIWFIVLCALFAFLTGLSLFMALSAIDCKRENEFEKNRTDKIVSNVSDGIIIYNKSFKVLIWNKEAENIFKIRKEDIIGEVILPRKCQIPLLKRLFKQSFLLLLRRSLKKAFLGNIPN